MLRKFINYLKDDNGQTSTEYILLVAVVAIIVFRFRNVAVRKLEEFTNQVFDGAGSKLSEELNNL